MARGVILDSHLNMDNDASEEVRNDIRQCLGTDAHKDAFIEVILAVDQTKDPALASAYKSGAIKTFSMGADVESTMCNICANVATNTFSFCDHVRKKHSKIPYTMADGSTRIAGELCKGTVFQELSVVADPADKTAVIQDGILNILKAASNCSDKEIQELVKFTAKFAKEIPESLAMVINKFFEQKGF